MILPTTASSLSNDEELPAAQLSSPDTPMTPSTLTVEMKTEKHVFDPGSVESPRFVRPEDRHSIHVLRFCLDLKGEAT